MVKGFKNCEICNHKDWEVVYKGKIRDGSYGEYENSGLISICNICKSQRLAEKNCLKYDDYKTKNYRTKLNQRSSSKDYFFEHDQQTQFTMNTIWPLSIRDKVVMDVGCGGGSLLDSIKGITKKQIAIEPNEIFFDDLNSRGYESYKNLYEAKKKLKVEVDIAFAIQVIEHTENPKDFLAEINHLLKKNGILVISTPNRNDILFEILPEIFPSFFYRVVHRWYFDEISLKYCVENSGYKINEFKYVHRYGMSNFLNWLKEKKPMGHSKLPNINNLTDGFWKTYLENIGKSDCLYLILSKK